MQPSTELAAATGQLPIETDFEARAVSPYREMGAYEPLWSDPHTTFRALAKLFAAQPGSVPSDFVSPGQAVACAAFVRERFAAASTPRFGVRAHGAGEYPERLRDMRHLVELLYSRGRWNGNVCSRKERNIGGWIIFK